MEALREELKKNTYTSYERTGMTIDEVVTLNTLMSKLMTIKGLDARTYTNEQQDEVLSQASYIISQMTKDILEDYNEQGVEIVID